FADVNLCDNMETMLQSNLPFPVRHGKIRDIYDLGDNLLIVATDRISAFDVVLPSGIPGKGKILTALSNFWFKHFERDIENHIITTDINSYPESLRPFKDQIKGRSMLVKKARVIPIECVARGYITGSGWKEYQKTQSVCGVRLPPRLKQCDKLPAPIFTPATKEESGHDINISFEETVERIGSTLANDLREKTLRIYSQATEHGRQRGVIIADTKFEFGQLPDGNVILIDEVLTPDSSRFWPADEYEPGHDQPSYDKQFVRNWLESREWDKTPPAPELPFEVIEGTRRRYLEAYQKLTGTVLKV
ncbi:MAG TPA: phosphoribosylaminoimidazolesuccinocarboxamide synthase, partial [Tepidisphaeraceae bacterium]|nr:phosphoribosylaminoimidazolesuccinocarboxamide synthase [Tepidisphaeraceae bacterium]